MKSDLSIMVTKGMGKVRHFRTSSRFLFWSALFFALYLVISVFLVNDDFAKRREVTRLHDQVVLVKRQADESRRKLARIEQHLALLKDYVQMLETGPKEGRMAGRIAVPATAEGAKQGEKPLISAKAAAPEAPLKPASAPEPSKASTEAKPPTPPAAAEQAKLPAPAESEVAIEDFAAHRQGARLTVSFKLLNVSKTGVPVRGYVHMIAKDGRSVDPWTVPFPYETLANGIPENFKRGQRFSIRHLKVVRGKFPLGGKDHPLSSLRIFVYDHEGVLLLNRAFELKSPS